MATNVFINNQQPQPPTLVAVHSNQWSTGICDCCSDLDVCCFACWCFPCFTCSTMSTFGENFCLPLLDMMLSTQPCTPPVSMSMRVAVRSRYGIQEDMTSDCMYATFCNTCSWCQIAREIKRRKQTLTIINAQPAYMGVQQYVMNAQLGAVTSQPMISAEVLTSRAM
ncbi:placenta-specific gene 8 protein-like [Lates calcarifer]|uniref:Placenta-specific gene 8 protein-like n=1 Tax=Lates calcarifer TaxID=8187 RepID=A0A4W6DHP5_LATCA|nr:placenta-specific gene 8 protein-like [Lates calcarifer]